MGRAGTTAACALVALVASGPALAREPETAALGWVRLPGAESCIGPRALAEAIESRIGRRVFVSPTSAELLVEARVEPAAAGGFEAFIDVTRADGSRIGSRRIGSESDRCTELGEKAVLVIALTIDPDAALKPPGSPPPPAPPAPPPAPPEPEVRVVVHKEKVFVPVPEPTPPPEPWIVETWLAATATVGLLPGVTPGLRLAVAVEPPGFVPIEASGSAWLEREAEVSGGGASFTLLAAGLALCPTTSVGIVSANWCGGIAVGSMRAHGFGLDHNEEAAQALLLVTGGLRLNVHLGDYLFVNTGLELEGAVVRPRFFFVEADGREQEIYRVSPVGGRAELGLGLRFSS